MGKRIMIEAFCRTTNGFEFCKVPGYSVEILGGGSGDGGSGLCFGVHKSDGAEGGWVITELSTGLQICRKRTRQDAEDRVRAMMGTEEGRWAMEEMIRRWPERAGIDVEALRDGRD